MASRRPILAALEAATGDLPSLCRECGGPPYPPRVRLWNEPICRACEGLLDEEGRPTRRSPREPGGPTKVIYLGVSPGEDAH